MPLFFTTSARYYEFKGDYDEAAAVWKQAMMIEETNPKWVAILKQSFQKEGYRSFVRAKAGWLESLIERDYVYQSERGQPARNERFERENFI